MVPNYRVHSTGLAAALATLGVELDETAAFSRIEDTDNGRQQTTFIFRDRSVTDAKRTTEDIIAAWQHRAAFEAKHPSNPLVAMRAAHDARDFLIRVIHGQAIAAMPSATGDKFETPHLMEAAILKAHGFPLVLFTGRAFAFPAVHNGVEARGVIAASQREHGQTSAQWMQRYLINLGRLLAVAKCAPVLKISEDDRTLLIHSDASPKVRDRFLDLLSA